MKNKFYIQLVLLTSVFLYVTGLFSCSGGGPTAPVSKPSYTSTNVDIVSNINLGGAVLYHLSNIDNFVSNVNLFPSNASGTRPVFLSNRFLTNTNAPAILISSNDSPNTNIQTNVTIVINNSSSSIITNIKTVTNTSLVYKTNQIRSSNYVYAPTTNTNWNNFDLSGWDLRDLNLTNYSFSNAILLGANLTNANLTNANLTNAKVDLEGYLYLSHRNYTGYISDAFQKILAGDGAANDNFGISVSLDGDRALIGAYFDDEGGSFAGSAYVFKRTGNTWVQEQKLTASDKAASDRFGVSVSLDGDRALIGAYWDDNGQANTGSAYVFKRTGNTWVQEQKLTASDRGTYDQFGISVSLGGDTALIGANQNDHGGSANAGSAYVFKRTGSTWVQEQKLTASDKAFNDQFGISVSLSGDTALIGAYRDDDGGSSAGSAYVFKSMGTNWLQEQKLTASDKAASDRFSISVSLDGDRALIGAYWDDDGGTDAGSAYVFKRTGTTWAQEQKLTASDKAAGDSFGISVSLDGERALIGAYQDDDRGNNTGSAYVVELE